MSLSKELKIKFRTVFRVALSWTIISILQLSYELAVLEEYGYDYRWSEPNEVYTYILINTGAFVVNGLIGGLVVVFLLQSWIRDRSYISGILRGLLLYSLLFFVLTCLQTFFVVKSIWDGTGSFLDAYVLGLTDYFFSYEFVRLFPFWLMVLIATLITLFVNDKYGPGIFRKFLMGKYFEPTREERIFMFLDLKGATTIAEKLGEQKYLNFLQSVFKDITPVLIETEGEVYQYVGDEVSVSWEIERGVEDQNCIRCFLGIQHKLESLEEEYQSRFGVVPQFKAGVHCGSVMTGEVGVIKREIVYSGDVLNTTARIMGQCNQRGVFILLSGQVVQKFPANTLKTVSVGETSLRGKEEVVHLFTL